MEIDLFTFIFQIINFIILIFLLYYFLFKRIVKVMNEREKMIQSKIEEANENNKKAQEEKNKLAEKQNELEKSKNEIFEKSTEEANKQKNEFLNNAKKEIEENKKKWQEEIEKQKEDFYKKLKEQIPKKVIALSNKVLKDLSNQSIQIVIIDNFIENYKKTKKQIQFKNLTIESALDFTDQMKQIIQEKIKKEIKEDISIQYKTNPQLTLGINFIFDSNIFKWDINSYLENIENDINTIFLKS